MAIPSFQDFYDGCKDVITSDPRKTLNDFTAGSWLDAFAAVAAAAAVGISRYAQRGFSRFFRESAKGSDLDNLIEDLFGPNVPRLPGESDDEYNARIDDYVTNALGRGTTHAVQWMMDNVIVGIQPGTASVLEDELNGITTLVFTAASGSTVADITTQIDAIIRQWRAMGRNVVYDGTEAT